jgi:hypothetical protein
MRGEFMNNLGSRLVAIAVVHLVIWILTEISYRFIPELNKKHYMGVYLILMPLGFGVFGLDLPYWFVIMPVLAGLVTLMVVFKRTIRSEVVRGSQSDI